METIGKPVYHNSRSDTYGSWMKDSFSEHGDYYWVTLGQNNSHLYEYANKSTFINKTHTKEYKLPDPIMVSRHFIIFR